MKDTNVNTSIPSNSSLLEDGTIYSTFVSRSRRVPSPIPPILPSSYPSSPMPPSSTPTLYQPRPGPVAIQDMPPPPSLPTTPPASHSTPIYLTAATTGAENHSRSTTTSSTLTPTALDPNSQSICRSPVSVSASASSSENSSSESGSCQQIPPVPPSMAFQPLPSYLTQVGIINGNETTTPFTPSSSSSSSKSTHRMHTITGKTTRREDPSSWKFPVATVNLSSGRHPELPNLGLGLVCHLFISKSHFLVYFSGPSTFPFSCTPTWHA